MTDQRRSTVYIDVNGFTSTGLLVTASGASAIQSALLGVSDADVLMDWEGSLDINPTPSPVNSVFNSVLDVAELTFSTTGTSLLTISLFAPKSSIFYADMETVDPSTITALIAAVVGTAKTTAGDTATAFVAGKRRRR